MNKPVSQFDALSFMRRSFNLLQTEIGEFREAAVVNNEEGMERARTLAKEYLDAYLDAMYSAASGNVKS